MSPRLDDFGDVLTVREVGLILRVGRDAAYDLVRSGAIPVIRRSRTIRVSKASLQRYINAEQ